MHHLDQWKSFMKFGIKKSHKMISYNLSRIALLSEWNYRSSTKPCYLAQTTLIELYNKSHEGFVLSTCQEKGLNWSKTLIPGLTRCCFDQDEELVHVLDMKFDL